MLTHILVVDDDTRLRNLLVSLLSADGYTVSDVSDGEQALARMRVLPLIGLVLLDLNMPVMDGWEVLDVKRRDEVLASVPVIIVTASGLTEDAAKSLGAAALVGKPLEPQSLLEVVRRYSA